MLYSTLRFDWPFKMPSMPIWFDWSKDVRLTKHKSFEAQITLSPLATLFDASIDLRWRGSDHAGASVRIDVLGLYVCVQIYDGRHWNMDEGRWYLPGEAEAEWAEWEAEKVNQNAKLPAHVLDLLKNIRDSFIHEEDGPYETSYLAVDSEAEIHHFEELCKVINHFDPPPAEPEPVKFVLPPTV